MLMPTPYYRFRMAKDDQERLHLAARSYGAKDTSDFARRILLAASSGDRASIKDVFDWLTHETVEQLPLPLKATEQPTKRQRKGAMKRGRT